MKDVRCRWCGGEYNLGKVEVTGRYLDCSVWKAPCCGTVVDDRQPPWGISHYSEVVEDWSNPYRRQAGEKQP